MFFLISLNKKTRRIPIPDSVRQFVLQRDDYQCKSCGKTQQQTQLTIDHIIPLAKGGSNDISNLQTLCYQCNRSKKDRIDSRFKRYFD